MEKLQKGDIFLTNNFRTAAKIVMFLMQSPTLWQHIWRKIRGTLEPVRFYHAGMVINETEMIEQQGNVRIRTVDRIFRKDYIIWRKKYLTDEQRSLLCFMARQDLGEGYGISECFGKLLSWLTGIKWFAKWFDMKDRAICVVRVAEWYKRAFISTFGVSDPDYLTTKKVDEYCLAHPEEWEIVRVKYSK